MAQRKHEPHRYRALAFLHEFSGDVVDGGDMVGVDGMAQPKAVCQKRSPQQQREVAKGKNGPKPGRTIE